MSHTNGKVARPRFAALITAVSMMMFTVAAIATHSPASASQVPPSSYGFAGVGGGDGFYTWDNICGSPGYCNSPYLVDNPVDTIYFNNASVSFIKNVLSQHSYFCAPGFGTSCGGGYENQFYYNRTTGSGLQVNADGGQKDCQVATCGPNGYDLHYRLYGANGYRLGYDPGWGFYAIGSIHYDVYEGSSGQWFGANEQAENYLGQVAAYNGYPYGWYLYPGTGSSPNGTGLGNSFSGWACCETNGNGYYDHYLDSNGVATDLYLP